MLDYWSVEYKFADFKVTPPGRYSFEGLYMVYGLKEDKSLDESVVCVIFIASWGILFYALKPMKSDNDIFSEAFDY